MGRDGVKITDQANVKGNALNTRRRMKTYNRSLRAPGAGNGVLLNSVCLNEAVRTGARLTRREEVEIKQRELVQLAKLKGVYDKEVLNRQVLLARSRLFREYAVELILGVEVYDKEKDERFEVEYLRDMIYHPNKYRANAVKYTVKDRTIQALVNLVLQPLVELTSDPNSYRPDRDCKMAIAAVRSQLKTKDIQKIKGSLNGLKRKGGNQEK